MGASASAGGVLQCPKGYDEAQFRQICTLFDKLDRDSNMGVSSDEMTSMAALHVRNCQTRLTARLRAMSAGKARALEDMASTHAHETAALAKKQAAELQAVSDQADEDARRVQRRLDAYASLDEAGKADTFMQVVGKGTHIDFWTFFEYMKHRTNDIKNL